MLVPTYSGNGCISGNRGRLCGVSKPLSSPSGGASEDSPLLLVHLRRPGVSGAAR